MIRTQPISLLKLFLLYLKYFFVFRLKRTWQKIQSAGKFAVLEHQMNPSSNFLSYRATLKAAISRSEGATDQRQRIVIPFFSLLVKDLLVVNEVSLISYYFNFDTYQCA